MHVIKTTKFN